MVGGNGYWESGNKNSGETLCLFDEVLLEGEGVNKLLEEEDR